MRDLKASLLLASALLMTLCAGGCFVEHKPGGNSRSLDMMTYESTTYMPIGVDLIDTRTGEMLWTVDVPIGQKLSVRFYPDKTEGDLDYPDAMRYEIFPSRFRAASMRSSIPVPPSEARRLDVRILDTPAYHAEGGVNSPS